MKKNTLRQQVIDYILLQIRSGRVKSDTIIKESFLCEALGFSRTPVREALIQLVSDGLLVHLPNKGYQIYDRDQEYKLNVYDIIGTLDGLAAFLACDLLHDEDYRVMEEILANIDVAIQFRNYSRYFELQEEFHQVYINQCKNPLLIQLIADIKTKVLRYGYFHEDQESLFPVIEEVQKQHYEILRLLKEKDKALVRSYLQDQHWQTLHLDMI